MKARYIVSILSVFTVVSFGTVSALGTQAKPFLDENQNLVFSSRYRLESYQRSSYSITQRRQNIKSDIIQVLVDQHFTGRKTDIPEVNLYFDPENKELVQNTLPASKDTLDLMIENSIAPASRRSIKKISAFSIPFKQISELEEIRFFDRLDHLWAQGYQVVGWRMRTSEDVYYRRHNIATALNKRGSIRVISPGEIVKFFPDIEYDPRAQKNYKSGYGLIGNKEVLMYAGGVCGGSTALYQGMLTHRGFKILSKKNHSTRYESYYPALINGVQIGTPGLDAMVFEKQQDLVFQNIRDYPLVIVTQFDGQAKGSETIVSLGKSQDQGTLIYDRMYHDNLGRPCYVRKINEEERVSCYKKLVGE